VNRDSPRVIRSAFSTVELAVIIVALAVLAALLASALFRKPVEGERSRARVEIQGLEAGLKACMEQYGLDSLPSKLVLHRDVTRYTEKERPSKRLLMQMFGKKLFCGRPTNIRWNGRDEAAEVSYTLYGQQCLVFFAGGIPVPDFKICEGFSADDSNPAKRGGLRYGPWFDFQSDRLIRDAQGFFLYEDAYHGAPARKPAQAYAFFSTCGFPDGYVESDCAIPATLVTPPATKGSPWPRPYRVEAGPESRYHNPTTFQILCAGWDGEWAENDQADGFVYDGKKSVGDRFGRDNLANFARGTLAWSAE
jgi:hypothetical protein